MNILSGPENDARHIAPDSPGGYEWWYFDAISRDGKYAVVAIYFLGTPMSPYYRAVSAGRNPMPDDWCGMFLSLHEKTGRAGWRERAYAYNLYSAGDFSAEEPSVSIGASRLRSNTQAGKPQWQLSLNEPGLWRGHVQANLSFTAVGQPLTLPKEPVNSERASDHTWVCIAPLCHVHGSINITLGTSITFDGDGYHDHNFGTLPWRDTDIWYWGRAHFPESSTVRTAVLYNVIAPGGSGEDFSRVLLFGSNGKMLSSGEAAITTMKKNRSLYGLTHGGTCDWQTVRDDGYRGSMAFHINQPALSEGPFYRRLPITFNVLLPGESIALSADGIGEVFQPSRLCGPIASRAMWSRMRRRRL